MIMLITNQSFRVTSNMYVKITTLLALVILIIVEIRLVDGMLSMNTHLLNFWLNLFFACLIPFVLIMLIINKPVSVHIEENGLIIRKMYGKIFIPFDTIDTVMNYKYTYCNIVIAGSFGVFGFIGFFFDKYIGLFRGYIGNTSQCVLVQLKLEKKYVFSCENSENLVKLLKNK